MLLVTWNLWWKMEMRVLESAGQEEVEFGCFTEVMGSLVGMVAFGELLRVIV